MTPGNRIKRKKKAQMYTSVSLVIGHTLGTGHLIGRGPWVRGTNGSRDEALERCVCVWEWESVSYGVSNECVMGRGGGQNGVILHPYVIVYTYFTHSEL